jgi:hypothetical protein
MSWPTTRRYPRTTVEAFQDAARATWHEGWMRPKHARWYGPLLAVAIGAALAMAITHWIDWSLT